jgi:CubicO group peptidase (beta-lactamase class C family)
VTTKPGVPSTQLAWRYGIKREQSCACSASTTSQSAWQPMAAAEIEQATQPHRPGASLATVAAKLGYNRGYRYRALRQAGVAEATVMGESASPPLPFGHFLLGIAYVNFR